MNLLNDAAKKNMIEIYQALYKISYIRLLVQSASGDIHRILKCF